MQFQYTIASPIVLKTFLQENQYSKKMISAIKRDGALLVNEKPVTVRKTMEAGDTLVVKLPDELPSVNLEPFEKPLDILFEDTYFIAVSKGKQQNCAPSREHPHGSLIEQVMGYLASKQSGEASPANPHIVTRLDRNTSGIVLFAKHGHFHHMMSHVVMNKIYHCIAEGRIEEAGNIVAPILRASDSIIKRQVGAAGKYAETSFQPIQIANDFTLCKVQLHTGRTHQIRVHFQYIGHPLLGDDLYDGPHSDIIGQALACCYLSFTHPITHECIELKDDAKRTELDNLFQHLIQPTEM
ncbi:RluA family pseudouridine synthase [Staphylococcus debuckii]|uniref:RNA pseudouridylate synthase n=1 Tax=Staphylococcus debuckii TaxID=2044912 RepID=A0ABU9EXZ5_9STAP